MKICFPILVTKCSLGKWLLAEVVVMPVLVPVVVVLGVLSSIECLSLEFQPRLKRFTLQKNKLIRYVCQCVCCSCLLKRDWEVSYLVR
jgi:hypothetical protein